MSAAQPEIELVDEADVWVERHLDTWARWMRRDRDEAPAGYLKRALGLIGYTHDGRGDKLYDHLDMFVAEAADACLEALAPAELAAVQNRHGLATFRFPRGNEEALYMSAKARLIPMLRRRNVV
jgi:hypothetical protein